MEHGLNGFSQISEFLHSLEPCPYRLRPNQRCSLASAKQVGMTGPVVRESACSREFSQAFRASDNQSPQGQRNTALSLDRPISRIGVGTGLGSYTSV